MSSSNKYPEGYENISARVLLQGNDVTKHGWLLKKSNRDKISLSPIGKYDKRFIIILGGWVYYFKDDSSEKPQGSFSLEGYSSHVNPAEEERCSSLPYVFKVYPRKKGRAWFFAPDSQREMELWRSAFKHEIETYNITTRTFSGSVSMPEKSHVPHSWALSPDRSKSVNAVFTKNRIPSKNSLSSTSNTSESRGSLNSTSTEERSGSDDVYEIVCGGSSKEVEEMHLRNPPVILPLSPISKMPLPIPNPGFSPQRKHDQISPASRPANQSHLYEIIGEEDCLFPNRAPPPIPETPIPEPPTTFIATEIFQDDFVPKTSPPSPPKLHLLANQASPDIPFNRRRGFTFPDKPLPSLPNEHQEQKGFSKNRSHTQLDQQPSYIDLGSSDVSNNSGSAYGDRSPPMPPLPTHRPVTIHENCVMPLNRVSYCNSSTENEHPGSPKNAPLSSVINESSLLTKRYQISNQSAVNRFGVPPSCDRPPKFLSLPNPSAKTSAANPVPVTKPQPTVSTSTNSPKLYVPTAPKPPLKPPLSVPSKPDIFKEILLSPKSSAVKPAVAPDTKSQPTAIISTNTPKPNPAPPTAPKPSLKTPLSLPSTPDVSKETLLSPKKPIPPPTSAKPSSLAKQSSQPIVPNKPNLGPIKKLPIRQPDTLSPKPLLPKGKKNKVASEEESSQGGASVSQLTKQFANERLDGSSHSNQRQNDSTGIMARARLFEENVEANNLSTNKPFLTKKSYVNR